MRSVLHKLWKNCALNAIPELDDGDGLCAKLLQVLQTPLQYVESIGRSLSHEVARRARAAAQAGYCGSKLCGQCVSGGRRRASQAAPALSVSLSAVETTTPRDPFTNIFPAPPVSSRLRRSMTWAPSFSCSSAGDEL